MPKATILFVDNDSEFLATRQEFLEREGYHVLPVRGLDEAKRVLAQHAVSLAIVDIRLEDDDDERDISGLTLVREIEKDVPKIILTGFPSYEYVRDVLRPMENGESVATDFVAKQEGPQAMLDAVRHAAQSRDFSPARSLKIDAEKRLIPVRFDISSHLEKDYEEVRRETIFVHRARLVLIVVGVLVIVAGAFTVLLGYVSAGALGTISGILAEMLAALLTRYAEDTNRRMDLYHRELLGLYKKEKAAGRETREGKK